MLRGRPRTSPAMERASVIAASATASCPNFLRRMVSSGVAIDRKVSETATPTVFSPKSRPAMARIGGRAAVKSSIVSWIIRVGFQARS